MVRHLNVRQQLLQPQHLGFGWGPTRAQQASRFGSLPRSRKALYLWAELPKSARAELQPGFAGKAGRCSLNLQTQGKFFMRNVRPGPPLTCLCCYEKHPAGGRNSSQDFLSSALSFDRDYPKHHCKHSHPLPQPPYLGMTDVKHLGACECPKQHSTVMKRTFSSSPASRKVQSRVRHSWQLPVPSTHKDLLIVDSAACPGNARLPAWPNCIGCPWWWIFFYYFFLL